MSYEPDKFKYILSVDIGVKHLGLSLSAVHHDFTMYEVVWVDMIDITQFVHLTKEAKHKCELYHDKTYTDYLEHLFFMYEELFEAVDYILIERQPPQGYVVVEQLIFSKYRNKAILISPNSVHKYLGWTTTKLDYEARKVSSIKVCLKHILRDYTLDTFNSFDRKHDMADSICMVLFWANRMNVKYKKEEKLKRLEKKMEHAKANGLFHSHLYLERFRYIE